MWTIEKKTQVGEGGNNMIFSLASDIGKVRKNNEDFVDAKIICKDDETKIGKMCIRDRNKTWRKAKTNFRVLKK